MFNIIEYSILNFRCLVEMQIIFELAMHSITSNGCFINTVTVVSSSQIKMAVYSVKQVACCSICFTLFHLFNSIME